jgi:uncharacterized protein
LIKNFKEFEGFNVTVHTNTNCTLKCSYCYENCKAAAPQDDEKFWKETKFADKERSYAFLGNKINEKTPHIISIDTAKKFIDQILEFNSTEFFKANMVNQDKIVLDFVGGDSLQYPDLLDEIITYFVHQLIKKNHTWLYSWRVSISSNGVTLLSPKARKFCEKWRDSLSLGISIDGCPELHDLNRWCFANEPDGSHMGSFQYIKEIWPWYQKVFQSESLHTKWTVAPNSYQYLFQSVKFLHEDLKMKYLNFNRVMENSIQDTPEQLWQAIQQFNLILDYVVDHHTRLYILPFDYSRFASNNRTLAELLKSDPNYTRCGFGKMPTVSLDGNIYPCFRMVPGHNNLRDSTNYASGNVNTSILEHEDLLKKLNENSCAVNMKVEKKCETCNLFSSCEHCAADCVNETDGTLTKTSSICNFHRVEVYYAQLYWEIIKSKHPELYKNYPITWTRDERESLMNTVLDELVEMKGEKNEDM